MATDYWRYKDGRFVEKIGYSPKLRVQSGGDALDVAIKDLAQNIALLK